jgi:ubiquinone/menaquinone biosynthesis C-methylase UbiE
VSWSALSTRQIQSKQRREIERLANDRAYAARMARHPAHASIGDWIVPEAGRRVLELGCGPGRYVAALATLGFEVVGIDPHAFPEWDTLAQLPNVTLKSDVRAESLPFEDATFDHVACLGALLYFDDPDAGLREARRVVRPGGRLVLRTVNRGNLFTRRTGARIDPASRQLYTLDELREVTTRAGFRVESSFTFGFWSPFAPNFYWYLVAVWMPLSVQAVLSALTPARHRLNNVVFATAV